MKNLLKGFIIGIGKIIPGLSGALLAILMGVYEKSIYYINNFKDNKKESIKYLLPLGIGVVVAIIFFSKIINTLLDRYYILTMMLFSGLIIGTIPAIYKEVKKTDYYLSFISLIIFSSLSIFSIKNNYVIEGNFKDYLIFLISGLIEAIGTIVPGVSSTSLLTYIGTYKIIISSIGNFRNARVTIPFVLGIIIGLLFIIRIIGKLLEEKKSKVYAFVLGMIISTTEIMIIRPIIKSHTSICELLLGLILLILGTIITILFENKKTQ